MQSKDREIDELKSTLRRLRDETETAQRESARERAAKSDLQATLEKRASLSAAEMAAQEQAHASAMQQVGCTSAQAHTLPLQSFTLCRHHWDLLVVF